MFPATPEVTEKPAADTCLHAPSWLGVSSVFLACIVTSAQALMLGDVVESDAPVSPSPEVKNETVSSDVIPDDFCLAIDRKQLIKASDATVSAAQKQSHVTQPVSYQFNQSFAV